MKKILFVFLLIFSVNTYAGNGEKFLSISGGYQYKRTVNTLISLEFEKNYHNSYEFYVDLSTRYKTCSDCNKICSESFFDYRTFGVGAAYKPAIMRGKNSVFRFRVGADLGANETHFQAKITAGLEYSYSFRNRMQIFVMQKNDVCFWSRHTFRNGLLIGLKIPINK